MSVYEALQLYRIADMYPPAHAVFRTAVKETHCRVHWIPQCIRSL